MAYYPKSQIKTNLYSEPGDLLVKSDYSSYIGYYWTTSKGEYFSGRNPQDLPNIPLIRNFDPENEQLTPSITIYDYSAITPENSEYNLIKNIKVEDPKSYQAVPAYSPTYPTSQDYQVGEFRRFFCKKTNEIQYIEIDPKQYSLLTYKDPQILWQLYYPFNIPWTISGPIGEIYTVNKNIVELTMKQFKLPRFNDYLKNDYTKYFDI